MLHFILFSIFSKQRNRKPNITEEENGTSSEGGVPHKATKELFWHQFGHVTKSNSLWVVSWGTARPSSPQAGPNLGPDFCVAEKSGSEIWPACDGAGLKIDYSQFTCMYYNVVCFIGSYLKRILDTTSCVSILLDILRLVHCRLMIVVET